MAPRQHKHLPPRMTRDDLRAFAKHLLQESARKGSAAVCVERIIDQYLSGKAGALGRPVEHEAHMGRAMQVFPYIKTGLSMDEALAKLQEAGVSETVSKSTYQRSLNRCTDELIVQELTRRLERKSASRMRKLRRQRKADVKRWNARLAKPSPQE